MKQMVLLLFSLLIASVGFADRLILNNQMTNLMNNKKSRIAIQWASTTAEVKENDDKVKQGIKLDASSLLMVNQAGKIPLDIPKNAEYFRILVWSKTQEEQPDLLTNWVDIVPNKTYALNDDHLIPLVLMSGMGC